MSRGLFVTGTGTDVGKTYVTSLMVKKLRESGKRGRDAKEHLDAMAAQIILQCFFENQ